jgi:hypothetical protein
MRKRTTRIRYRRMKPPRNGQANFPVENPRTATVHCKKDHSRPFSQKVQRDQKDPVPLFR